MPSLFQPPLIHGEVEACLPDLRVEGVLGTGGQGVALRVHAKDLGPAALKIYGATTTASRVEREVDKLARLRSSYVVRLYDHGEIIIRGETCRYALLEFVDGVETRSLTGRLSDSEVDAELRRFLTELAQGVADMWSVRVVHRDLKPSNIMRRVDGRYVVLDLGLAKHLDESTLTQAGFTCGTPGYMSPEQAAARRGLTLRSDMFAVGIVAYELATGSHPFLRRQDLVGRIMVPPLVRARGCISSAVSELVARLLDPRPMARPSRVDEVLAILAQ